MTIAELITKRDLQRDMNYLLYVLQDHVADLAPVPLDITDEAGWDRFILSAKIINDIGLIRLEVMK